ncbi:hypothetical protein A2334_02205 [Candidatus Roizmanbacteria bacterium RIFOXYB2_FULL_38_10]|uniref:DNA-binding transcriptional regulator n=1 Tax=Candidatus Roizmanbacteria bacterium RIFOXYD1_FULL_38_12 TaxID=1802093 RepID=A0A1F7L2K6_9BACT|nr:MAG: hypothetical protein A3K47_01760 [Candidatus Roizmanbacteria bacterium RIFOXYA2_FULL_38_14]OGK64336.1 MAG: hypothetical protein A3K27_01760 [Candidatus Roizmanbacteria bacterium RIFOXYA1_FULL_37_12]OGK66182.1 MAG: hypothetical protein A3K38_01760 [Candidatus Roizmanbacteria bacterium RIFOXYB1_FULL_40_23]OGK68012.1 MAG: hypothetical protein A2334_02205 [Candidatus Roizmanbacteria bacterium RIFOXYB2_FULL_38_10]OGK70587.1 MAG: hypothetical protein A3K21_01765 [Candidatus Roizmanbacteria ba
MKDNFSKPTPYKPANAKEKRLMKILALLNNEQDVANLFRDLLTHSEIEEFANRIEILRLLKKGFSYQKIAHEIGSSTTTVTRVAHWLYHGSGGYQKIIDFLD